MILDFLNFSFVNLRKRQLRSWLTIIGIVIGIGAVVALISLSVGLTVEVERQFEMFGSDKLFISRTGTMGFSGPPSSSVSLTEDDIKVVKRVDGIDLVATIVNQQLPVKFKDETKYMGVIGISSDEETQELFDEVQGFEVEDGRQLKPGDSSKATIGSLFAEGEVFDEIVNVRDTLEISGNEFKIIGLYKPIGNTQDDSSIIISIDDMREITGNEEDVTVILAKTKDGLNPIDVKEDLEDALRDAKDQEEGEESFNVNTSEDILRLINQLFGTIQAVLIGIGAISLLVGAVGVMNTMYTSVLERTKEIGIMKSIGGTNSDILQIFLIESGIIGLFGGTVGILVGLGMAKAVEIFAGAALFIPLKAYMGIDLIIGALILSFLMGTIAGVLPAKKAANMKPADALRYE